MFFVVLRRVGPEWDKTKPMESQGGWDAHAPARIDRARARLEREEDS